MPIQVVIPTASTADTYFSILVCAIVSFDVTSSPVPAARAGAPTVDPTMLHWYILSLILYPNIDS